MNLVHFSLYLLKTDLKDSYQRLAAPYEDASHSDIIVFHFPIFSLTGLKIGFSSTESGYIFRSILALTKPGDIDV